MWHAGVPLVAIANVLGSPVTSRDADMLTRTNLHSVHRQDDDESGFDPREMIGFLWRQWKFIASVVVVTMVVAAVYVWTETPRYSAAALVLLEPQKDRSP